MAAMEVRRAVDILAELEQQQLQRAVVA